MLFLALAIFLLLSISGESAPEVSFTTITGKKIALNELRGNTVIVTFWASDCPACIKEMPDLIDLYRKFHDSGLEIIAVAMAYDPPSHVVAMSQAKQLPYDVALDLNSAYALAFGHVQWIPSTFLIDPKGHIVKKYTGTFDLEEMKQLMTTLTQG